LKDQGLRLNDKQAAVLRQFQSGEYNKLFVISETIPWISTWSRLEAIMEFSITSIAPEKQRSPCVIVGVFAAHRLSPAAARLDNASKGAIMKIIKRGDLEGKLGQSLLLHHLPGIQAERVLLVGCGEEKELNGMKFREIVAKSVSVLNEIGTEEATSYLTEIPVADRDMYWKMRQAVEVASDGIYRFDQLKSKKENVKRLPKAMQLHVEGKEESPRGEQAVREGQAIAKGVALAKDLANLPSNHCTPTYLAEQARGLQKAHPAIKVQVLNDAQMRKLGMGALLAVAQGSREPSKLIVLEYKGAGRTEKPVALVGKGITFDTGGISLKPAASMDEMKYDMSGAASVLGVFSALAELKLPINVVGLIPTTENMPGGNAIKPGDIVKSLSGQTIEILNTDAEGRLILCDALTYAERYKPSVVIDIATLTGACVVALGAHASGLLSNHEPLAADLLKAGQTSLDRAWQLPLWDDYQKQLDSPFADFSNVGGKEAGTITAACFLSRFTRKFHWAHLDIAGTAWRAGNKKGATGRPVPLLVQYLLDQAQASDAP
jgi:leucyl aminopeptidase